MKKIKIKLKDLQELKKDNKVFIDSIEGRTEILDTYVKHGEGFHFVFDDNSEIKCHVYRKFSDDCKTWKDAQHYQVGDYICGKKIISKDNVNAQDWYDFSCDNETESYIYNGIHHHNSGKSFTIYCMIRYILKYTDFKILINVPSISLVEQLFSDFKDYTIDDWNVDEDVTKVYSKSEENPNARIVISTWQSCASKPASYYQQFDAYFCDEAHGASAKVITGIIDRLAHAKVRVGLTGTLDGTDLHELEMIGRFGRLFRVVTTADLMDSGDLAELKVNFLKLKYPLDECKLITKKSTEYQEEIAYILDHEARNKLLIKLAMNQKKNTLMLFQFVDRHGKKLLADMNAQADKHLKKVFFIYQKVSGDERELIRKTLDGADPVWYDFEFENGAMMRFKDYEKINLANGKQKDAKDITMIDKVDIERINTKFAHATNYRTGAIADKLKTIKKQVGTNILLASYGTLSVGVNIKNLHCLILCHPLKAKIKTLQSIGRILRTADGKGVVKLIDIADDFSYTRGSKVQSNIVMRHYLERLKIYESEKFSYDINEYKLGE